jgi:hypothetical protein
LEYIYGISDWPARYGTLQDEVIDILLHNTPHLLQNEMERQGFDPMASMANEVVDFMENIKAVKEKEQSFEKVKSKNKDIKKKSDSLSPPKKKKFYSTAVIMEPTIAMIPRTAWSRAATSPLAARSHPTRLGYASLLKPTAPSRRNWPLLWRNG